MAQTELWTLADWFTPNLDAENRRDISRADARCVWMFEKESATILTLGQIVDRLLENPGFLDESYVVERLVHISDYLDYLSEMDIYDEVENLLSSIGFSETEVKILIKAKRLPSRASLTISTSSSRRPDDSTEEKLLQCRGMWVPASARLLSAARLICPIDIKSFDHQLALAINEPNSTVRLTTVLSLQHVIGAENGIRIDRMQVLLKGEPLESVGMDHGEATSNNTRGDVVDISDLDGYEVSDANPPPPLSSVTTPPKPPEPTNHFEQIESEGVRFHVRNAINRFDGGRGLCLHEEVMEILKEERLNVSAARLTSIISRLEGISVIGEDWIAVVDADTSNTVPLIDRLARKVISVINGVPIEVLHGQLARDNAWFKSIPTNVLEQRIAFNTNLSIRDHAVFLGENQRLFANRELSAVEHNLWNVLVRSDLTDGPDLLTELQESHQGLRRREIDAVARNSVVLVKTEGRIIGLRRNQALYELILENAPFVQTFSDPLQVSTWLEEEKGRTLTSYSERDSDITVSGISPSEPTSLNQHLNAILADMTVPEEEVEESEEVEGSFEETLPPPVIGSTTTATKTVRTLLEQVSNLALVLPSIQRGYVWKPSQVKDLFDSLYRGFPVGTMLVWETSQRLAVRKVGDSQWSSPSSSNSQMLLLDGQQRMTSLYLAMVTGRINIYFNATTLDGSFRSSSTQLRYSIRSIPVRGLNGETVESILRKCDFGLSQPDYVNVRFKIERLLKVLDRLISVDTLHEFDYEQVTDVFVRVNSRGTKLKAAELAIAGVAYRLPDLVTDQMSEFVDKLSKQGWSFTIAFFIRLISAEGTGRVAYGGLNTMSNEELNDSWNKVKSATSVWLEYLRSSLGLGGDEVLAGTNTHIVPIVWLARHGLGTVPTQLAYWFVLATVFSRYTSTSDTNLDQDFRGVHHKDPEVFVNSMLPALRAKRSSLRIEPSDVERAGQPSALLLLMYLSDLSMARTALLSRQHVPLVGEIAGESVARTQIVSNQRLRAIGYGASDGKMKNGGLANLVFVSSSFAEGENGGDLWARLKSLDMETRYQHGLPLIAAQESLDSITQFLNARSRQLVEQFNGVLNTMERGVLVLRPVVDRHKSASIPNKQRFEFDSHRRKLYEEIRRRLYDLEPRILEKETGVYVGFLLPRQSRPFATVAFRKRMLNFAVDVDIDDLHDPQGWCRDVTLVSKHGIGNTSFVMSETDQLNYAMKLLEQVIELKL